MDRSLAVLAVASFVLVGCGTVGDADIAASVGDAELTVDELGQRAEDLGMLDDGRIGGDDARVTIANWIGLQAAERAGLVDRYRTGPVESGVTCVFGVPAPDAATGDDWLQRLRDGEPWADIAAEAGVDSVALTRTECLPTAGLSPIADQLAPMSLDDPYALITFEDQTLALVKMQSVEELNGFELLIAVQSVEPAAVELAAAALDDADVAVASRYGAYDPDTINVVPLGSPNPLAP